MYLSFNARYSAERFAYLAPILSISLPASSSLVERAVFSRRALSSWALRVFISFLSPYRLSEAVDEALRLC
jgi:hypothetical protein